MKCAEKVRHPSLEAAMIALKRQPMKAMTPYKCKQCGYWHLSQNKRRHMHFQDFIDRVIAADKGKRT